MKSIFSLAIVLAASCAFAFESQEDLAVFLAQQDRAEIKASDLARTRTNDQAVLGYAARVSRNHAQSARVLASVAHDQGLDTRSYRTDFDRRADALAALSGDEFKQAYKALMVDIHQQALVQIDASAGLEATPVGSLAMILRARVADGLEKARAL